MEGLGAVAQRLGEGGRADWHRHELLKIDAVVGVLAAVEDVHHRHRQPSRPGATEVGVKRQARRHCGRPCHRHRDAQDGVGPERGLVRRAIQVDHQPVDLALSARVHADQFRCDPLVDIGAGLEHALAAIALLVAVAQLDRLVLAGGCTRRHRGGNGRTVVQGDMDPHCRIAAGIQDLVGMNAFDDWFHGHFLCDFVCSDVGDVDSLAPTSSTACSGSGRNEAPAHFRW